MLAHLTVCISMRSPFSSRLSSMPPKRIGAAAAAAGTPPPPAMDTSMAAISKLETQLAKLKPVLYSKTNLSESLRQLHELESHADSIYKANNLGPDEEVPAKDVLDAIRAVAAAISVSGDTPLLTSEQIKASKISEEKQLAAQEAAHRARYSPTKAPAAKANGSKKPVTKTSSSDIVATAAAVRANIAALTSPKKGRGAKRGRISKSKKPKQNPDGDSEEEEEEEQSEPELDDEPEQMDDAADEIDADPFAFAEDDAAAKPAAKGKKGGKKGAAKLNGTAHAAAATAAASSPAAAAAPSSKKASAAAAASTSNGRSSKKSNKKSSDSPAPAASPRAASAPAAKKAKTAAASATSNSSTTTRTTRSRR